MKIIVCEVYRATMIAGQAITLKEALSLRGDIEGFLLSKGFVSDVKVIV